MVKSENAFTLVELIIVIVLIGILASIALVRYGPTIEASRRVEAFSVLAEITAAEKRYLMDNDAYTGTITDLDTFNTDPSNTSNQSSNFDYSIGVDANLADGDSSFGLAISAHGGINYYMCFGSGKKDSGAANCP